MAEEREKRERFWQSEKGKKFVLKALLVVGLFLFAFRSTFFGPDVKHASQLELLEKARQGQVAEVVYLDDTHLRAKIKDDPQEWDITYPEPAASDTFKALSEAKVGVKPEKEKEFPWDSLLTFFTLLMVASLTATAVVPGIQKVLAKAKGKDIRGELPETTLNDVKGVPEVVTQMRKFAQILKDPQRARRLGARLPAGVVLYGPPGTGKTMLAKALAGETGVPFYEVASSAVRTKWVGDASKAIRAYFDKARRDPVSIMFFDEGDVIGRRRSNTSDHGVAHEHDATVSELLTQMGSRKKGGHVFVVIATNNPDVLDDALTRPGRIDLKLAVLPPDVNGRKGILEVHTQGKQLADDVDLDAVAKETYGDTGADLEALVNLAALEATERGADKISNEDFQHAQTLMKTGPARSTVVSKEDKRITAHHEGGHALCLAVQDLVPTPTSVTILSHGYSGGHTAFTPDEEKESNFISREAAKQQLIVLMGGQAGEKLALDGDLTNGPSDDRHKATALATRMVCEWGMGTYNSAFNSNWRGGPHADQVWEQVEALLDEAEMAALDLLLRHKTEFDALVARLLEKETLRASDLQGYSPNCVSDEEFAKLRQEYGKIFEGIQTRERLQIPLMSVNGTR